MSETFEKQIRRRNEYLIMFFGCFIFSFFATESMKLVPKLMYGYLKKQISQIA